MPQIKSMSVRALGNFRVDGLTATAGILLVNGDKTGGFADWTATARGGGNNWSAQSDNGYTAFAVMSDLTANETYDARVIIAGQTYDIVFTTPALATDGTSGKQPVRRSNY